MKIGTTTQKLAEANDLGGETRAMIRETLTPIVGEVHHLAELIKLALDGVDPEFALYEFVQMANAMPALVNDLEERLSKRIPSTHRRAA